MSFVSFRSDVCVCVCKRERESVSALTCVLVHIIQLYVCPFSLLWGRVPAACMCVQPLAQRPRWP